MLHTTPISPPPVLPCPRLAAPCIGYGRIVRMAYAGDDLSALTRDLVARVQTLPADPGALLDLATLLMLQGGALAVEGATMQRHALHLQRSYQISHGSGTGLRILALVTPGDFMANTPLDFLLHGSDAVLILHFVDAETPALHDLPDHDAAFMAIGESPEHQPVLRHMQSLLAHWPGPIVNRNAASIASLSRDEVAALLADAPGLYTAPTQRHSRADLIHAAMTTPVTTPLILRPLGSHAGAGMARIATTADLAHWLRSHDADHAYTAPFIDYRGANGLYAKQRIVLINGKPFASHMASSLHWMVHYLNADMSNHPARRADEAAFMAGFDADFAQRHATAFASLHHRIGLDYFGIDCAEMPDGRLLIFEVDVAMIVHDMDCPRTFPYKIPAMQRLFSGFLALLSAHADPSPIMFKKSAPP